MTAFADFIDLQTAVVEHVRNPSIVDVFPRLVRLAEVMFNRRLRCREQITTTTLTITSGSAALPSDYAALIGVFDAAGVELIQQPVQALQEAQTRGYYAMSGSNVIAKSDEVLSLIYYARVPTITDSLTDSNWLLQKHPGVYLYGVGLEAAKYLRDAETAQATMPFLDMEIDAANGQDAQERYGRVRVRVQGVTP
jgi:hypothetical protein